MSDHLINLTRSDSAGIPSYCTANPLALEACMRSALASGRPMLIEATANQVNQFGGYTGMKPADFRDMIFNMADAIGLPRELIILGGDHLGPLVWSKEDEASAMAKSEELVRAYVEAGFEKIHLDTSMRLGDDDPNAPLSDETIARRGARLCKACEEAWLKLRETEPDAPHPAYIIGSEVPIPGGATEKEDSISVTSPQALKTTYETYKKVFSGCGLENAWPYVIGIVVQPGAEFGDEDFFVYNRDKAAALTSCARGLGDIVLEGHSTDYQPRQALRRMVEDRIAILKVGPALTFAVREALFALSHIEAELVEAEKRVDLPAVMEALMLASPANWERHYHGTPEQLKLKRKYSFSDRCRYYFSTEDFVSAVDKLFENLDRVDIPLSLLHQYMPIEYDAVVLGNIKKKAKDMLIEHVMNVLRDYEYAAYGLCAAEK